jgi:hypothetical protein
MKVALLATPSPTTTTATQQHWCAAESPGNEFHTCNVGTFGKVFKHWLTGIKRRKKKEISTDCFRCQYIEETMAQTPPRQRGPVKEMRKAHREHYCGQKNVYKGIYQRCMLQLTLFLSCIFDGMDQVGLVPHDDASSTHCVCVQWKTYCPWLAGAKNLLPNWRLKQKITGLYFHGLLLLCVLTYAWTSPDANINMTGMHHALHLIQTQITVGVPFAPYWFVQVSI